LGLRDAPHGAVEYPRIWRNKRNSRYRRTRMKILAAIGALAVVFAVVAAVFFCGGFYRVAGRAEEPAIVKWALNQVRTASIARDAHDQPPPGFDDPAKVQARTTLH